MAKKKHRPFIYSDKLGRIYKIGWEDMPSNDTPQEFKPALNMFRGRQIKNSWRECLDYIKISLRVQSGDQEAKKELTLVHKGWNPRKGVYYGL